MIQLFLILSFFSLPAFAQPVILPDHDWAVTDISFRGFEKESLFTGMNREIVRVPESSSSDSSHVWAYEFMKNQNLDTAKIFLFYTEKNSSANGWYSVAPVINEFHTLWVMDASFPENFDGPVLIEDWTQQMTNGHCKEIRKEDRELVEHIKTKRPFPERTSAGVYDCYYLLVPAGHWKTESIASALSGDGEKNSIQENDVYEACLMTSTNLLGRILGEGRRKCTSFMGTLSERNI